MEGSRLIQKISVRNLLSFGPESMEVELEPVNILIGPNASGKSNLLEVLSLLSAAPQDLTKPIREGGGVGEWLWKGGDRLPIGSIDVQVYRPTIRPIPLRHRIQITQSGQRLEIVDEVIEDAWSNRPDADDVYFYYRFQNGYPALNIRSMEISNGSNGFEESSSSSSNEDEGSSGPSDSSVDSGGVPRFRRQLRREDLKPDQSVLSQRKDPDQYPEVTYLGERYQAIRMYREYNFGRYTAPRLPQKADLSQEFLSEQADNLALVLNDLEHRGQSGRTILERLREFYPEIEHFSTSIVGGTVQLFIHERGLRQPIPATRLSDGTLRYLCLLAVLCHPTPPPLVCIEEPELGLHPDAIPSLAELILDASLRTQLIVTTHSQTLVSEFSETPECVLVSERSESGTCLRRLKSKALAEWLDKYQLGELWRMGEIGGNR